MRILAALLLAALSYTAAAETSQEYLARGNAVCATIADAGQKQQCYNQTYANAQQMIMQQQAQQNAAANERLRQQLNLPR